jgi:protein gp37
LAGAVKKRNGRALEGKTWDEMPRQNAKSFEKLTETALF